jgi:hypothetical protein
VSDMVTAGDTELPTLSGVYDPINNAVTEGAQWAGSQRTVLSSTVRLPKEHSGEQR